MRGHGNLRIPCFDSCIAVPQLIRMWEPNTGRYRAGFNERFRDWNLSTCFPRALAAIRQLPLLRPAALPQPVGVCRDGHGRPIYLVPGGAQLHTALDHMQRHDRRRRHLSAHPPRHGADFALVPSAPPCYPPACYPARPPVPGHARHWLALLALYSASRAPCACSPHQQRRMAAKGQAQQRGLTTGSELCASLRRGF